MPTNSRPMAVSPDSRERRRTRLTPPIITAAPTSAPSDAGQAQQQGAGDARQHAVRERVADEGQAAQHDEGAHDGACKRHQAPRDEGPHHELVVEERIEQGTHGRLSLPSVRPASTAAATSRMKVKYEPSSGRLCVAISTTRAPGLVGDRLGDPGRRARLVEDRRHALALHLRPQRGEVGGRHLGLRAERRDQRPDELEVVAVGEVAHRLVAGHQLAAGRGDRRQGPARSRRRARRGGRRDRVPAPARSSPRSPVSTGASARATSRIAIGSVQMCGSSGPWACSPPSSACPASAPNSRSVTWSVAVKTGRPRRGRLASASSSPSSRPSPFSHHQVGLSQRRRVLGRGLEVVGVDPVRHQHLDPRRVADEILDDRPEDRRRHDDRRT